MTNRLTYIDSAKGLSIFSITLLHYEDGVFSPKVNAFIGIFMITLFFVSSGWVKALVPTTLTLKEFISKRFNQIGKPYIYWTLILLAFDCILWACGYYDFQYIGKEVFKSLSLRGIGTLWFLPSIFFGEILWFLLKDRNKYTILTTVIIALVSRYTLSFLNITLTSDIDNDIMKYIADTPFKVVSNIINAFVCIEVGYFTSKLFEKKLNLGNVYVIILAVILWLLSVAIINISIANPIISFILYSFIHWAEPIAFILFFRATNKIKLWHLLSYWGVNSLCLMVTHYTITLVLARIIVENGFGLPFSGYITLICFVISLLPQYLIVAPINKYAPFLLGKK